MQIKGFYETKEIFIIADNGKIKQLTPELSQKLYKHSPDGFNWGYSGSGPAQLSLAILLELTSKDFALFHHQDFKRDFIAGLEQEKDFTLDGQTIINWLNNKK
ncbi:MAG: DUF6166 domain-containing protein [bacterium]